MSFEPGAPAAPGFVPLSVPDIRGREWEYVKTCLESGWVSSVGAFVDRFESAMASRVGVQHAVATVNGTAALHVALLVAGVQPDDEVLVPTLTFIAPVNAIRYAGAWPVLVDAESDFWQLDVGQLERFLKEECRRESGGVRNTKTGRRVAAILPVHVLGHPADMSPLLAVAREYDLVVIEDATESLGSRYRGQPVGSMGDLACFSFNGNKILTTGGGGMLVTRRSDWAARARYLTTQAKDDPVEYIHHAIGYNYRLTNLQAAMGCAQLEQLDHFVARRRAIAQRYREAFSDVDGLAFMAEAPDVESNCWLSTVRINADVARLDSRALLHRLQASQIQTRPLWTPAHMNAPYRNALRAGSCAIAEALHRECLSLPSSSSLTDEEQDRVIAAVREALGKKPL